MQTPDNTVTFAKQVKILHTVIVKLNDIKNYLALQGAASMDMTFGATGSDTAYHDFSWPRLTLTKLFNAVEEDITDELDQRLRFLEEKGKTE